MAALSEARLHSATAPNLTPPTSDHDDIPSTQITKHDQTPVSSEDANEHDHDFATAQSSDQASYPLNGDPTVRSHVANGHSQSRKATSRTSDSTRVPPTDGAGTDGGRMAGNHTLDGPVDHAPHVRNGVAGDRRLTGDSRIGRAESRAESRAEMGADECSQWIHRDKLARIESEELQAAGFKLPKQRSYSRVRRDTRQNDPLGTQIKTNDGPAPEPHTTTRSRKNSIPADQKFADIEAQAWDLRHPDEIAADVDLGFSVPSGLSKGGTRIPVARLSPAPIPLGYLERPKPVSRSSATDGFTKDADSIAYPKPRARSASERQGEATTLSANPNPAKRSATDMSPKKATAAAPGSRKASSRTPSTGTRPKTRSGHNKGSVSSNGTRPSTRSGELNTGSTSSKQPEGEPPWMLSSYRPDPRLPPDQQLLPTVARRLQQEKWEKEGKFGNVLDKEFRSLTDDGFLQPPEKQDVEPEPEAEPELEPKLPGTESGHADEWPLKMEAARNQPPKSPGQYSTMPRIQDNPHLSTPLPSPRTPGMQQHQSLAPAAVRPSPPMEPEDEKSAGCTKCCVVM